MEQKLQLVDHQFRFKGKGIDLLIIMIKNFILTLITLGIYYSWAKVDVLKFYYSNTELEGNRFRFHGTGKEIFFGMIKAIGILIAGGLFLFFLATIASRIHDTLAFVVGIIYFIGVYFFVGYAFYSSKRYRFSRTSYREIRFRLDGNKYEFAIGFFKGLMATIFTFGFMGGYLNHYVMNFMYNKLNYGSAKFSYVGNKSTLVNRYAKDWFLTIITFGIYSFWLHTNLFNYMVSHLQINGHSFKANIKGGDYFGLVLVNAILTIVTLGIATPWVQIRTILFFLEHVTIDGNLNLDDVVQTHFDRESATGEGLSDAMDMDLDLGL